MLKIFIGNLLPNIPPTEILYPNLGNKERETPFGEKIFAGFNSPIVEIVNSPDMADYLCIPHNYNYIKKNTEYISEFVSLAELHKKRILIFFPGDSDKGVDIAHTIIFRNSQYKSKKKSNEVIMPAYAVDLGERYTVLYRNKGAFPVVGFCGWADFRTFRQRITHQIKCLVERNEARKPGIYFRRLALASLENNAQVKTNFIVRSSYSGSDKTLSIDPAQARSEYVENMKSSDFVLAPKGDGNFSVRFFEALSLGRIPLLIDTDCVLPLEDEIDYKSFVLRVPYCDIDCLPERVTEFYGKLSGDEYPIRQRKGREAFAALLKIDKFFTHVLTREFLDKLQ